MLAERFITILPDLTFEESLEITKIQSITGTLKENLVTERPFRAPHYSITGASLIGGGKLPKPGEISLAHLGVLFLDELPEFSKKILELLRGPLEDKKIVLVRSMINVIYPSNFILIASMNPCPCGYYGSKENDCKCTELQIKRYREKISGPILDRIDLHVEVMPVKFRDFANEREEYSKNIKERVDKARKMQLERYKEDRIFSNSELDVKQIDKYCKLNNECKIILEKAFSKLNLSARGYSRILKVARTIADLDSCDDIRKHHLIEAIQYRSLDKS